MLPGAAQIGINAVVLMEVERDPQPPQQLLRERCVALAQHLAAESQQAQVGTLLAWLERLVGLSA